MASPVTPLWRVPRKAETNIGNPVLGRTLIGLAGALNHLNGLQARGFVPVSVYQDAALAAADPLDSGYFAGERQRYETIYAPFYVSPGVDLLHIALVCLCWESGGTQAPEVTVDVLDSSGVVVDEGCTWTRAAGHLPGDEVEVAGANFLRPFLVESTTRFVSTDPTSGPTAPRRLSVGAEEGNVVILRISTIRTQIVAALALPVPPSEI